MSPHARLSLALPLLVLLQACGMKAAEQAEPAAQAPAAAAASAPRLSYSTEASANAEPSHAASPRYSRPQPAVQPIAARLPISRPDGPPQIRAVVELPLPSDAVWIAPERQTAADPLPAAKSAAEDLPRVASLQIADEPVATQAWLCDCLSLICPIPVEACLFLLAPDPNRFAADGLLNPALASAGA